jgi:hypothetical protein
MPIADEIKRLFKPTSLRPSSWPISGLARAHAKSFAYPIRPGMDPKNSSSFPEVSTQARPPGRAGRVGKSAKPSGSM